MSLESWFLFCTASVVVILIPGPLSLLMVANTLNYGIRNAWPAFVGGVSASLLLLIASAAGLGALLLASEQLFSVLKYIGAAYLIWLGCQSWQQARQSADDNGQAQTTVTTPRFRPMFLKAFALGISNPKDILFFVAFLPQFIDAGSAFAPQLITMVISWAVLDLCCKLLYGGSARLIAPALRSGRGQGIFNRVCGGLFVSAGASAMLLK